MAVHLTIKNSRVAYPTTELKHLTDENSCTVWAFASAFDVPYEVAYEEVKKRFMRSHGCGARTYFIRKHMEGLIASQEEVHGKKVVHEIARPKHVSQYKSYGQEVVRRIKISSFIKEYPKGNYYILVRNHAVALRDGVLYDNTSRARNYIVERAYQIIQ